LADNANQQPPLLAHETFVRVLRVARLDGLSVMWFAGFFALVAAANGDFRGAIVGVIIAAAGAIELHGAALLRHGAARGVNWLVGSQLYLMAAVIGYCAYQLAHPILPVLPSGSESFVTFFKPMIELTAQQLQMTTEEYLLMIYRLTFRLLALLTFFYQGGMAVYYLQRRDAVTRALADE
jgi:hypothetical protein